MASDDKLLKHLERVEGVLGAHAKRNRLLSAIAWSPEVEDDFFASGAKKLPNVECAVDREAVQSRIAELAEVEGSPVVRRRGEGGEGVTDLYRHRGTSCVLARPRATRAA